MQNGTRFLGHTVLFVYEFGSNFALINQKNYYQQYKISISSCNSFIVFCIWNKKYQDKNDDLNRLPNVL